VRVFAVSLNSVVRLLSAVFQAGPSIQILGRLIRFRRPVRSPRSYPLLLVAKRLDSLAALPRFALPFI